MVDGFSVATSPDQFANKNIHSGMLDGNGKATIPKAPKAGVTVYYGLTREDARDGGQQDLRKEHQKLVNQLKQQLDAIISNKIFTSSNQKSQPQHKITSA